MPRLPVGSVILPAGRLIGTESITWWGGATTMALSANIQYWWPIVPPKSMTVAQLWFRITTPAAAGSLANIGLYESGAGSALIGALLASKLAVPIDGVGGNRLHTLASGLPVDGGRVYWMSIQPNAAVTLQANTLRIDMLGRGVGGVISTGATAGGVLRSWTYANGLRVTNPVDWTSRTGTPCGGIVTV